MKNKNIYVCTQKENTERVYYDCCSGEFEKEKKIPFNKGLVFLSLIPLPLLSTLNKKLLEGDMLFYVFLSLIIGILIGVLASVLILFFKKSKHRLHQNIDNEKLTAYLEAGEKELKNQLEALTMFLIFFLVVVGMLVRNRTHFYFISVIYLSASLIMIVQHIDYFRRKRLYMYLKNRE